MLESLFFYHRRNHHQAWQEPSFLLSHLSSPSTELSAIRVRSFSSQRETVYTGNWLLYFLLTTSLLSPEAGLHCLGLWKEDFCTTTKLPNNNGNNNNKTGWCAILIDNCRAVLIDNFGTTVLLHTHQTGGTYKAI